VPHAEGAKWWGLVRHFSVVGRLPAGGRHLEGSRFGRWVETRSTRSSLILSFPRAAGKTRPLVFRDGVTKDGYIKCQIRPWRMLPLPVGAFAYSPGPELGKMGCLYRVVEPFDPAAACEGLEDGRLATVMCEELLSQPRAKGLFTLDLRGPPHGSYSRGGQVPWAVEAQLLCDVSHLVKETVDPRPARGRGRATSRSAVNWFVMFD
jgi:hypothetical protein